MKKSILKTAILALFLLTSTSCQQKAQMVDHQAYSFQSTLSSQISESEESSLQETFYQFDQPIKLYINPSVQYQNPYTNDLGNEGEHMRDISLLVTELLSKHTNLTIYANNALPGLSLSQSVKESNTLNANYHIALHSNAGGGEGSEGWYTSQSYAFTNEILSSLNKALPFKSRGLKNHQQTLYELKHTNATACLIEVLFHDEKQQAIYLIEHKNEIAYAIYQGILSYFIKIDS